MVKVKICGLRRLDDISYVNELGIDYAGFVFAPSPRRLDLKTAAKLIGKLDRQISKVGVFVNAPRELITQYAAELDLDVIQLHGDETPADVRGYTQLVWKAFNVRGKDLQRQITEYAGDGLLLDAPSVGKYGGTGQPFDWSLIQRIKLAAPLILAGGLHVNNVTAAIEIINPAVVDVSSGVEINGYKDFGKMKKFVERVRQK